MKDTERLLAKGAAAVEILRQRYPDAECSLESGGDPWRLLVMARLSAQCTDERVNIVCRDLFREIPDAQAMAEAPLAQIEELIRPCGLFRTKAKSLKESAAMLLTIYEGRVPDTMEELLSLPGVGRKIANLLLGDIYKKRRHRGGYPLHPHHQPFGLLPKRRPQKGGIHPGSPGAEGQTKRLLPPPGAVRQRRVHRPPSQV